jgi:thioredoxin reductase (NADPH)
MTKSSKNETRTDVLIIGGGPAGLSAFLWCKELGMSAFLVEQSEEFGGQLLSIHNPINNYLGRTAKNGCEMAEHFVAQTGGLDGNAILNTSVVELDTKSISAVLSNGTSVKANAVIIATGIRRRRLDVPGENEFAGHGILESGAKDKLLVLGKSVAIVGGGDAALENALILSEFAEKIYVIHRRSEFSARAEFVEPVLNHSKIEIIFDSAVTAFCGGQQLSSVSLTTDSTERQIPIDAALIRIGVEPNSDAFQSSLKVDARGYILTDVNGLTSVPMIYAIGDVANPISPTISTAAGGGASAAKAIYYLINVHRHL